MGDVNISEYQEFVKSTAQYTEWNDPEKTRGLPIYAALGLCGEAGELVEKIKKLWRNEPEKGFYNRMLLLTPATTLLFELGDVLWYLTEICNQLDISLEDVMAANIVKLSGRVKNNTILGEGDGDEKGIR